MTSVEHTEAFDIFCMSKLSSPACFLTRLVRCRGMLSTSSSSSSDDSDAGSSDGGDEIVIGEDDEVCTFHHQLSAFNKAMRPTCADRPLSPLPPTQLTPFATATDLRIYRRTVAVCLRC
jgi:hypothetical protein